LPSQCVTEISHKSHVTTQSCIGTAGSYRSKLSLFLTHLGLNSATLEFVPVKQWRVQRG